MDHGRIPTGSGKNLLLRNLPQQGFLCLVCSVWFGVSTAVFACFFPF